MALEDQLNSIDCGSTGTLGAGLAGCQIDRNRVATILLTPPSFRFTDEITLENIQGWQQTDGVRVLKGIVSFVDATADPNIVTRPGSGIKKVAGENPYEYTVTFDNGYNFFKAVKTLEGYQNWNMVLIDIENNIFLTQTKSGAVKGYGLGMFYGGKYMGADGAETSNQTISLQILNRQEVDKFGTYISAENVDFSYDEIDDYNDVTIEVLPVSAGTTVSFKAMLIDKTHAVKGLSVANIVYKVNGSAVTPSNIAYSDDTATLTVASLSGTEVVSVELNGIVLISGVLYKSNVGTAIVTA